MASPTPRVCSKSFCTPPRRRPPTTRPLPLNSLPHDNCRTTTSPRAIFLRHRTQTHRSWLRANEERARLRSDWQRFFTEHDVLVTPAAPTPAIPAGSRTLTVDGQEQDFFYQTGWANLTSHIGLPSLVVPVTTTTQGLPVGVQIIGRSYADRVLLAVADGLASLPRASE
ncbi:amidase family protein [Streptomyces phaeochromogenes]